VGGPAFSGGFALAAAPLFPICGMGGGFGPAFDYSLSLILFFFLRYPGSKPFRYFRWKDEASERAAFVGGRVHTAPGVALGFELRSGGAGKTHGQTGPPPRRTGPYAGSELPRYLHKTVDKLVLL